MKTMITVFCLTFLFMTGCKTSDMLLHPGDYIKRDTPREYEIVRDTIVVYNDNGQMNTAVKGLPVNKRLIFSSIGESYSFKSGEAIEILMDNVDMSVAGFDIVTDDNTGEITLKLIDKAFTKVKLESKCQTVVRTGIDFVPKIEVAQGLKPEQIVVTPMFDDNCMKIGYQIRYGSTESGCRKEAREVLVKFKDCGDGVLGNNKRSGKNDPCRIKRKLGIPCP